MPRPKVIRIDKALHSTLRRHQKATGYNTSLVLLGGKRGRPFSGYELLRTSGGCGVLPTVFRKDIASAMCSLIEQEFTRFRYCLLCTDSNRRPYGAFSRLLRWLGDTEVVVYDRTTQRAFRGGIVDQTRRDCQTPLKVTVVRSTNAQAK